MQVEITCRHGSIGEDFQDYISRKSEKLLTYFERVTAIVVTIDFVDDRVRVEMQVDAEHKHDFVAHHETEASEAGACFEQVLHKMEQQIRKYKDKIQDHRRDRSAGELASDGLGADDEAS